MKRVLLVILSLFLVTAAVEEAYAQQSRFQRWQQQRSIKKRTRQAANFSGNRPSAKLGPGQKYVMAGVNLNSFNYFGDLSPTSAFYSTDISFTRPGFGIYGAWRGLNNRTDIETAFNWGILRGDDASSSSFSDPNAKFNNIRNLSFRNQIYEWSASAKIFLFPDAGQPSQRRVVNPYGTIGASVFFHNPKAQIPTHDIINNYNAGTETFDPQPISTAGEWVALRPLHTEGQTIVEGREEYSLIQPAIIGGAGVRYRLAPYIDLGFEINIRYLFFDYIDDVSTTYVDLGLLESDLARVMSDRSLERLQEFGAGGNLTTDQIAALYPSVFQPYVSAGDNQTYAILPGRGRSSDLNQRGSPENNDVFYVASFKLTYILGGTRRPASQFR